jgi:hypothetical protein
VSRQQRAQVLDEETRAYLKKLADKAPPFSDEQRAVVAAAFRGAIVRPKQAP